MYSDPGRHHVYLSLADTILGTLSSQRKSRTVNDDSDVCGFGYDYCQKLAWMSTRPLVLMKSAPPTEFALLLKNTMSRSCRDPAMTAMAPPRAPPQL